MDPDEFKKCQDDPLYWYNTYYKKPDDPILTRRQFEQRNKRISEVRNKVKTLNDHIMDHPMTISESFKTKK